MSSKSFLTPVHTFATLDDDLYGTRSRENQVKTISARKADREGHTADAIADALFRITLMVRFRRRGESQSSNVSKLMNTLLECRGERSLHGLLLTADRGYGSVNLLRNLLSHGIGSIFIMPEHILRCHPFVGRSFFDVSRDDENDGTSAGEDVEGGESLSEDEEETTQQDNDGQSSGRDRSNATAEVGQYNAEEGCNQQTTSTVKTYCDRRRAFVIDDSPAAGPASYFAVRSLKPSSTFGDSHRNQSNRTKVTAVAIRESGTKKYSNIVRFMYTVPTAIGQSIETWIAVPKTASISNFLFSERDDDGRIVEPDSNTVTAEGIIERALLRHCSVLTIGQRCADWFILRQFRVTGTVAGKVLLSSNSVRQAVGIEEDSDVDNSLPVIIRSFAESWFSSSRSTEAMMRGTVNEKPVLDALSAKPFVSAIFECAMLCKRDMEWLACSPDGVALIDVNMLGFEGGSSSPIYRVSSVEIKTSVSQSSLDNAIGRATVDVIKCVVGDTNFRQYIPKEHVGQVLQQMLVLSLNYIIYISAAEVGILYIVVVNCPNTKLQVCKEALTSIKATVEWAYESDPVPPEFTDRHSKRALCERLPFWITVNQHVQQHGPFPPLKLFKHGAQSLYSKTKGGVDGSAQARAVLRSSTSSFAWEQKIVPQTLKTLAVNGFIAWRMTKREDLLQSKEQFGSLEHYRETLNGIQSLADFTLDVARELLVYADNLHRTAEQSDTAEIEIPDDETRRLCTLAKNRRSKPLFFLNSDDGVKLRLYVRPHPQRQLPGRAKYCALCGNSPARRRTTFTCTTCDVHVCARIYPGQRKSCWNLWHESKRLVSRDTSTSVSRSRSLSREQMGGGQKRLGMTNLHGALQLHQVSPCTTGRSLSVANS